MPKTPRPSCAPPNRHDRRAFFLPFAIAFKVRAHFRERPLLGVVAMAVVDGRDALSAWFSTLITSRDTPAEAIIDAAVRRKSCGRTL